jgi:hypothetical protein
MSDITSLPVEFLFHMHATLDAPVKGPKVNGTVAHLGADWLTMRADGTAQLDVRALINTDDGAAIHVHYTGIMAPGESGPRIITAPLFEAGDERYTWLNAVQAVAVGAPGAGSVDYDIYRIL